VGENIHWLYIRQSTDNQNIQGDQKTKLLPISEPIKKWATELNRTFSKEEIKMAKKHMKKMLTIPGHKGNTNRTTLRFHLSPVKIAIIKTPPPTNVDKDVGKKEPLYTAGGNVS
jgi:hypothetical protein